jgi:predicted AAA+ superfamily ATPase
MKKIILILAIFSLAFSAFATSKPVKESIVKKFKESYPTASDVRWFQGENQYQVSFWQNDVRTIMYFNDQDQVYRTLRYYEAKQLCPFIATKIKDKYAGKSIKSVAELTNDGEGILYEIVLEDSNRLYIVHSDDSGNLRTIKKLIKS